MAFPKHLQVCVEPEPPEGPPPKGLLVTIYFQRRGQANYAFDFGPTDANGCIVVTAEEVETKREEGRKFYIMDYRLSTDRMDAVRIDLFPGDEIQRWLRMEEERRAKGLIHADDAARQKYLNAKNALFHPVSQTVHFGDTQADSTAVVLRPKRKENPASAIATDRP